MTPRQKKITVTLTAAVAGPLLVAALIGAAQSEVALRDRVGTLEVRADQTDARVARVDSVQVEQNRLIIRIICDKNPSPLCP